MALAVKEPESDHQINLRGFAFIRFFILSIIASTILLIAGVVILGWDVEMEISVEASGHVEPVEKKFVKSEAVGTVKKVLVHTGQQVAKGDTLFVLDASEWKKESEKIKKESAINKRQIEDLRQTLFYERERIASSLDQARLEYEASGLRLEQILQEQQLYRKYLKARGERTVPVETLLPVRLQTNNLNRVQKRMAYLQ